MLSLNILATVVYLLSDYLIHFMQNYNGTLRQLPMRVEIPYETMQLPTFELLVLALCVHIFLNAFAVTTLNGLLIFLVSLRLYTSRLHILYEAVTSDSLQCEKIYVHRKHKNVLL